MPRAVHMKTTPTIAELEHEIAALRQRVAELEIPARRYQALLDGGIVSMMIYDRESRALEVNRRWEQLWNLRLGDLTEWRLLADEQVSANGSMPLVERAFLRGEATALPTIRYDPVQAEPLQVDPGGQPRDQRFTTGDAPCNFRIEAA
ncbi:hypothetical protein [Sorangium sp. So ce362]|uniref:hypothetical protein n=1 Tax=Sorangium sp. So ce362 TaxID=3133303 RepID=UPI003F631392